MERIDLSELDLKGSTKITKNTLESNIYVKEKKAYKIYKKRRFFRYPYQLYEKRAKILILEKAIAPQLIKPDGIIMDKNKLAGIRMDYIENLGTLYDLPRIYNDVAKLLKASYNASRGLKEIHNDPTGIVVQDLNFYNIIFDTNLNTYYVDSDSYQVRNYPSTSVSKSFAQYCEYHGFNPYLACERYDRFQFVFELLSMIYGTNIENVTAYEYDALAEKVSTLKNMRLCFKKIKKSTKGVPNLPYVCDLISTSDFDKRFDYDLPNVGGKTVVKSVKQLTR